MPTEPLIQLASGRLFNPLDAKPDQIHLEDIAHALSLKCRFNGHSMRFYSVARHSILVARHCSDSRWGLMHDAAEAYLADVPRPLKPHLRGFIEMENRLMVVIAERFNLGPPPSDLNLVDLQALAAERRQLMRPGPVWEDLEGVEPLAEIIPPTLSHWDEIEFIERARFLGID